MKKELWIIIICLIMATPSLSYICVSTETQGILTSPPTPQENCGCGLDNLTPVQHPIRTQLTPDQTSEQSGKPTTIRALPSSFSWRDLNGTDWTTTAQDQGNCGSCWDFAAIGALESIIQIREGCPGLNLDLSEQYVLSCLHSAGTCKGGSAYNAYRLIYLNTSQGNNCNGIIPEFCFPYQVNDHVPCANASLDWHNFLIPITAYGHWSPHGTQADRDAIKTQIMTSGPVVATMMLTYYPHGDNNLEEWGWTHHNATDYYPYPGPLNQSNHQVVIVGWKDDPAITNGGYWIVKNSFSPEWGNNGYFNLEYGSLRIDSAEIVWVDYNPANYSNWVPIAHANGPYESDGMVTFNASSSFDHEGTIDAYHWDFGDGATSTDPITTHVYTGPGIYPVTLTVTDNDNNTGTDTTWAFIKTQNHAPQTPALRGRRHVEENTTYSYTFFSKDTDGDNLTYYLNWGDTYWDGGSMGWIGPYTSGQPVTLDKLWPEKGNYTVRVKAMDPYGAKSDWATIKVTFSASPASMTTWFWDHLLAKFPHAFPILRHLFGYD